MQAGTSKILKNVIIGGLFLIPFLPFIVSGTLFFPFITGKNFAFRIIIEIIFSLWLALVVFDKSYLPKKNNILLAVVSFIGIIAVADIFGANFYRSFWSNYERMEGLVSLLHLLAYFILLISVFNERLWRYFFNVVFISGAGLMLYGAFQLLGKADIHQGGVRLDATFGNATYFAVHMLFLAFLSALFLFRSKLGNNPATWIYGSLVTASVFMLLWTGTRGTAVGLIVGFMIIAVLIALRGEDEQKKFARYFIGGAVVLFLLFLMVKDVPAVRSHPILGRFAELSVSTIMNQPRYMVWNMAWNGFKERPVLGWGQDNFNLVFNKYYDPKMWSQEPWFDRAHNVFFDWLIAGGIFGLGAYLSIFYFAALALWKKRSETESLPLLDKSVLTGLLVGYFIHNIFVFDNLLSYIMFLSVVAYIYQKTLDGEKDVSASKKRLSLIADEFATYVALSLLIVGTIFSLYYVNIKPIMASNTLIKALSSKAANDSLDNFKQVVALNTFGTTEAREQLTQRAMTLARMQEVDMMTKQSFFLLARDEMTKQVERVDNDARYRVFLGALFSAYGMIPDAIRELTVANELSPKKQTIMFELTASHINKGDYSKALEIAKKAFDLEPGYQEARDIYAIAAIYAGKNDLAKELLVSFYKTDIISDERFVSAYAATKQYKKIIEIRKLQIEKDPNNFQYHINLSAAYLENKQRDKSIEELKKAAELNPAFKPQADIYIKEIRAGRNPQ